MVVVRPRKRVCLEVLAFGALAVVGSFGCSSEHKSADPSAMGTVAVYTATLDDGTSETQYFLRDRIGEERLWFATDPGLLPGATLEVWGEERPDGLRVSRFRTDATIESTGEALINAPPFPPRTFGFVLVDIGGGINLTAADAQTRLFGTAVGNNSVKQYYDEVSYATQDITGEILGPLSYAMVGCDTKGLAAALKPQLGVYDHYLWYMGSRTSACSWSGLAEVGTPTKPTNDTWYNGTAGCVVLVQEPGHNFGMQHSSSMTCGTAPFADDPETACQHVEYGDKYDPMGGACNHMNAWQKVYEGWLQKCNAVKVGASGTFTLEPLEPQCDGIQVLQIPMPKIRPFTRAGGGGSSTTENIQYYYLELRTARGFDQSIRTAPTVLVHVAEDFHTRTDRGRHTWLLDMDPTSTRTLEGLGAGQSYTDPAGGVSFNVASLSVDAATINVTVPGSAAPTCLDGSGYDAAAPATCVGIAAGTGGTPGTGGAPGTGGVVGAGGTVGSGGAATGSGGVGAVVSRVDTFTLIDANADTDVLLVNDGMTLDLDTLPPALTLRADTDPTVVGSVAFIVDGAPARIENIAPYSVSSDDGKGNFAPWTFALGTHTVTATPYGSTNGMGTLGEALTVTFTLARGVPIGTGGSSGVDASSGNGGASAGAGGSLTGAGGAAGAPALGSGATAPSAGGASAAGGFGGAFAGAGGLDETQPSSAGNNKMSCSCRVPGRANRSSSGAPAIAFGVAALALGRSRRKHGAKRHR